MAVRVTLSTGRSPSQMSPAQCIAPGGPVTDPLVTFTVTCRVSGGPGKLTFTVVAAETLHWSPPGQLIPLPTQVGLPNSPFAVRLIDIPGAKGTGQLVVVQDDPSKLLVTEPGPVTLTIGGFAVSSRRRSRTSTAACEPRSANASVTGSG